MATIALEEHLWTPGLLQALRDQPPERYDDCLEIHTEEAFRLLLDAGEERLRRMDAAGVDVAVLSVSTPGTQSLLPAEAVPLAIDANDRLAEVVRRHPERFGAFATLPTPDPSGAADELHRAVTQLGMVGAMVFPRTGERYLDHASFRPVFEVAAELAVPLYLHPQTAPRPTREASYGGLGEQVSLSLAMGGWGWHIDAGLAAVRLILAGTFDRHPGLQLILGHWGEVLVPFSERVDVLSAAAPQLERRVGEYITGNVFVTPSGILSPRMLAQAVSIVGADRVLLSTDYPYVPVEEGALRRFVDEAALSPLDKERVGHRNAERLLRLEPGDRLA